MTGNFEQPTQVTPKPFLEINNQGQVLRLDLEKPEHRLGRGREWADLDVPIGWEVCSRRQAVLVQEGDEYRIFDGDKNHPSRNGVFLNHTRIDFQEGYLLKNGVQLEVGQSPHNRIVLTYFNPNASPAAIPTKRRLVLRDLKEWPVQLGRGLDTNRYASMQLDAPTVSRLHATILPNGKNNGHILQDNSTNGTFVDGQRIDKRVQLKPGNIIHIGPFSLLYQRDYLEIQDTGSQIRLDVHNLIRKVKDKEGNDKTILNNVSLVIEPGQLVALVGGSGAGKSTLMKSLLGIEPVSSGVVFLNGDNLRQNWAVYRTQIGYVPQDDIVHPDLRVEEVLAYACKLRLPPDTDIKQVVETTLTQIQLTHVRDNFIRNLSGGQRKRVSIGVELLADPKLFFLDEPTSGLDPGLDKEMMHLLRELANQGRTVVLVTHATANIEACDRITFMGRGGQLCYFGEPREALNFFEMPSNDFKYFSDIYIKLDQGNSPQQVIENVEYWASKYQHSSQCNRYVKSLLKSGQGTKFRADPKVHTGISPFKQLWLLSQRYFQLVVRDRTSWIFSLLSGPIAIALTAWILRDETPLGKLDALETSQNSLALKVLFIFACIGIWVGLSSSVREIVKEAAIYARERLINLGLISYLGSKLLIRSGLTLLQTFLIVAAVIIGFKSPESDLISWFLGLGITVFLSLLASVSLSLMISALVKNENAANSILPLIMIPQIILSGVLFELKGIPAKLGWLTISRWSMGAYGALVDVNSMIPENTPEEIVKASDVYDANWENLGLNWGILVAHMAIYIIVALIFQKRKDVV